MTRQGAGLAMIAFLFLTNVGTVIVAAITGKVERRTVIAAVTGMGFQLFLAWTLS